MSKSIFVPILYRQSGIVALPALRAERGINNLRVFNTPRKTDSVHGHHQHYTFIAPKKVDIPEHLKHLTIRVSLGGEHQLMDVVT